MRSFTCRLFLLLFFPLSVAAATLPPAAAIASAHPLATQAGHEILAQGGNAFDAAVAVAAALAVVEPYNSGLGGGGFFLLHRARDKFEVMIDARERAPLAATKDMYLNQEGKPIAGLSIDGACAAAIPGVPAALVHLAKKYGRLPLKKSLMPAIRLARDGFAVSKLYAKQTLRQHDRLQAFPVTADVFYNQGFIYAPGEKLRQPQLARTLERLAAKGHDGFYRGMTAVRLVDGVRAAGGIWSQKDLADYRVSERAPVRGVYRNMRITSAPLPSSGGVGLIEMLNILQGFDLVALDKTERDRHVIEAMRLAYRDRAQYLGDADFVSVDAAHFLDPAYAAQLRQEISDPDKTPQPAKAEGTNTTHFSIIDRAGNRVAATLSINTLFGSGFMPADTGVLLNNEMDDFVLKPNVPNTYGLIGSEANAIAPGKRPLSSMTPTFLETDDEVVVLGTPGGSRIISMVLLAALELADRHGAPKDLVNVPRFHHQYSPNVVEHEAQAFDDAERHALEQNGYRLQGVPIGYGNMQIVAWSKKKGMLEAVSDPRGEGSGVVK
ncbi:MAG: gamma-glutamyltransferase [Gammaproteobacteria bacterium]|nr:gamma-glutamyltransferase [Gammaproteobacteria bacterium]